MHRRSHRYSGLWAFQLADGIRWEPMRDGPVMTKGAFDSQDVAFWDPIRQEYRNTIGWDIVACGLSPNDFSGLP